MRNVACASLVLATSTFAAGALAQALAPAPDGAKRVLEFTATAKLSNRFVDGRNTQTAAAIQRVLKGRCTLAAGAAGAFGLDGPTKQQEQAMKRDPSLAFTPAVQVWFPQSCSGSFATDETHTANIQDGGNLSYQATSTIKGSAAIPEGGEKGWLGVYVEHDLVGNQVQYRFNPAPAMMFDKTTVRTGYKAGTTTAKVPVGLVQGVFPNTWGPVKGPMQAGTLAKAVDGGTLTIEWQVKR